jgi:TetR/AcrR family transcriptional regulator, cholesterol catabolism regulator
MKIHSVKEAEMPPDEAGQGLERLLDAAETLFLEQGYSAIKLKHIAEKIKVRESSIYYHFPKGKEQLFVAVMKRNFERHREGIANAIANAGEDWVAQLRAVGYWLISQPAIDVMRMSKSDLPAIDPATAHEIEEEIYSAVNLPILTILEKAHAQGKANVPDSDLIAGIFVGMVASIDVIKSAWNQKSKTEMVDVLIDSWVNGLRQEG